MTAAWVYVGTGKSNGAGATAFLARRGVIWVPGNLVKDVGPAPGDLMLLFWRQRKEDVSALFLGAATIAAPIRQWGHAPWLDTIPARDPLYQEASRLGYGGPPNYMTMARLDAWAEDSDSVRALFARARPGLRVEPGLRYRGIPPDIFLFPVDDFHPVVDSPPEVNLMDRIVVDPKILQGKPVLRGLRIAVEHVLGWIAAGARPEEILADYPELEMEDIQACAEYARRLVSNERIDPAAPAA